MYRFPHALTLSEVQSTLQKYPSFPIRVYDRPECDYVVFNYGNGTEGRFPHPSSGSTEQQQREYAILRELRGLIFDRATGSVRSRRLHKFFNINELPEVQADALVGIPFVAMEKLDGVLITPFHSQGNLVWGTKAGETGVAKLATDHIAAQSTVGYTDMANEVILKNATPIFELCSVDMVIVVEGANTTLTLIQIRENDSGEYWPLEVVNSIAAKYNVPCAKPLSLLAPDEHLTESFLPRLRLMGGIEGAVLVFANGVFAKAKTSWYLDRYHIRDQYLTELPAWQAVLRDHIDDVKPLLPSRTQEKLIVFQKSLLGAIHEFCRDLTLFLKSTEGQSGKEFADAVKAKYGLGLEAKIAFKCRPMNPEEIEDAVRDIVASNCCSLKGINSIRSSIGGGAVWKDNLFDG